MSVSIFRSLCAWTKLWPSYPLPCVGHSWILSHPLFVLWLHFFSNLGKQSLMRRWLLGTCGWWQRELSFHFWLHSSWNHVWHLVNTQQIFAVRLNGGEWLLFKSMWPRGLQSRCFSPLKDPFSIIWLPQKIEGNSPMTPERLSEALRNDT